MPRLTLNHVAQSRLPQIIGVCSNDFPSIAAAVNSAQERLVFSKEAGDQGFYGSYAEMAFNILQSDPYITLGRYGARLMDVTACNDVLEINNQFYEYLRFGNGKQPRYDCSGARITGCCGTSQVYARGVFPSFRDLTAGHFIRVRAVDTLDTAGDKRTLIQGTDSSDNAVTSLDGALRVQGIYLHITAPFVDLPLNLNKLTGIQKDATNGPIEYWDVDPVTGVEVLILTMEPGELVSGYPRYYFHNVPLSCCPVVQVNNQATVQVKALVKLNLIPVIVPTDYLLIQCLEAIIAECQSMRYSSMDLPASKQMALSAHRDAIRLLNGELTHYYGTDNPAVSFEPFGSAHLENQAIGTLM